MISVCWTLQYQLIRRGVVKIIRQFTQCRELNGNDTMQHYLLDALFKWKLEKCKSNMHRFL